MSAVAPGAPAASPAPEAALSGLAEILRAEDTVISPHVAAPSADPVLGLLAASGPRAASAPGAYALIVEAVREGYLLHYGEPRVVRGADEDLALLAGDYLYAMGLKQLAGLGDLDAIRELSDLISLSAQIHDAAGPDPAPAAPLWLAAAVAVAAGPTERHEEAKGAARSGDAGAGRALWEAAAETAAEAGGSMQAALESARDAIGFAP